MRPPHTAVVILSLLLALPSPRAVGVAPPEGRTTAPASARSATQRWTYPIRPAQILRAFDRPPQRWAAGHRGVDLRARPGRIVRAIGAGRVVFARTLVGRGVVVVEHGALRSTYEPVAATVRVGDRVAAGQSIGTVATGSGHCGSGRCLHLGVRRGTEYLDPLILFGSPRVVLVPW